MSNNTHTRTRMDKLPTRTSSGAHEVDDYMDYQSRFALCAELLDGENEFSAYTDGSCWNSDPDRCGGSAYVLLDCYGDVIAASHKGFKGTSSNRMEMLAIVSAIASTPRGARLQVFTDSEYAIKAFLCGGASNQDLIGLYHKYAGRLAGVKLTHIRGHKGNPLNEWCDYWSNREYKTMRKNCKQTT